MGKTPQLEDGYVRIANELYDALCLSDFSAAEYRILLFVIRQTYGYNRKTKRMTAPFISHGTGIPESTVEKRLNSLKKQNVIITVVKGVETEIGINKSYREWVKLRLPKTATSCQKRISENGNFRLPKTATSSCQKRQPNKDNIKDNIKDNKSLVSFSPLKGETHGDERQPLIEFTPEQRDALNTELAKRKMKENGWTEDEFLRWRFQ